MNAAGKRRSAQVEQVKREAVHLLESCGDGIPLQAMLDQLGCSCGRPGIEEVSTGLAALFADGALTLDERRLVRRPGTSCTPGKCTGASSCPAEVHVHGCYADMGSCDNPHDHGIARLDAGLGS